MLTPAGVSGAPPIEGGLFYGEWETYALDFSLDAQPVKIWFHP
jgi:hypothetical protein